jgi:hypothetical protein
MQTKQTQEQRIAALEKKVNYLQSELTRVQEVAGLNAQWVSITQGAKLIGISEHIIRNRIFSARTNPSKCLYKKGVHWRGEGRYQVNVSKWKEVLESGNN